MKKLTSTLGIFALAIGAAAAMAMSQAPKKVAVKSSSSTMYHWFKISDGTYLGTDTEENKRNQCGEEQDPCVLRADGVNGSNQPTGTQLVIDGQTEL